MNIDTFADLEKLIDLCHTKNVYTITVGDVTVQLQLRSPAPEKERDEEEGLLPIDPLTGDRLSREEFDFYLKQYRTE